MIRIILADAVINALSRKRKEIEPLIQEFYSIVEEFTTIDHFIQDYPRRTKDIDGYNVCLLKCRPMAWRIKFREKKTEKNGRIYYRHDMYRIIFTTTKQIYKNDTYEAFIILRIGHRKDVYDLYRLYLNPNLGKKNLEAINKLKTLSIHSNINDSDFEKFESDIEDTNQDKYHLKKLYQDKGADNTFLENSQLRVLQLKGCAGTGKTYTALELAVQAAKSGAYPIVVFPNKNLQEWCVKRIQEENKTDPNGHLIHLIQDLSELNLKEESRSFQVSSMAILVKDQLLQYLANDPEVALSLSHGDQLMRSVFSELNVKIPDYLNNINLYSLYLGFNFDPYEISDRDPFLSEFINNGANEFINDTNYQSQIQKKLGGKDACSQARRASENLWHWVNIFSALTSGNKQPVLIIDEIQDFYWSQLKTILDFYQCRFNDNKKSGTDINFREIQDTLTLNWEPIQPDAGRLVILAGDNNQRVTFSGFSWAGLANSIQAHFPNSQLKSIEKPFSKNRRNSIPISFSANYLLSAQAIKNKAFQLNSSKSSWIAVPPLPSLDEKILDASQPRLVVIQSEWLNEFKTFLEIEKRDDQFIFIIEDESLRDELENSVHVLNTAEAKGQEFNSLIILYPFSNCVFRDQQPTIQDLFRWYTALTRARKNLNLLVSPEELEWLKKKVIREADIEKVFDIEYDITVKDFISVARGVENTIELSSKILNLTGNALKAISDDQQSKDSNHQRINAFSKLINLSRNYSVVEILVELEKIDIENVIENRKLFNLDILKIPFEEFNHLELLFIYIFIFPLLIEMNGDRRIMQIDNLVVTKMKDYFTDNSSLIDSILKADEIPISQIIVLRATHNLWNAAKVVNQLKDTSQRRFLNEQISEELKEQGLVWDSARFRYHYLSEEPIKHLPYLEVLKSADNKGYNFIDVLKINVIGEQLEKLSSELQKKLEE